MKRYQIAIGLIKAGVAPKEFLKRFDTYMSRIPEHSRFPKSKEQAYDKPLADKIILALEKRNMSGIKENVLAAIEDPEIHKRFMITDALQENLEKFFSPEKPNFHWNDNYREAKQFVFNWFAPHFRNIKAIELSNDMEVKLIRQ